LDQDTGGDTAHTDNAGLVVGDIGGIDIGFQQCAFVTDDFGIVALWRADLSCHCKLSGCQDFFQSAA